MQEENKMTDDFQNELDAALAGIDIDSIPDTVTVEPKAEKAPETKPETPVVEPDKPATPEKPKAKAKSKAKAKPKAPAVEPTVPKMETIEGEIVPMQAPEKAKTETVLPKALGNDFDEAKEGERLKTLVREMNRNYITHASECGRICINAKKALGSSTAFRDWASKYAGINYSTAQLYISINKKQFEDIQDKLLELGISSSGHCKALVTLKKPELETFLEKEVAVVDGEEVPIENMNQDQIQKAVKAHKAEMRNAEPPPAPSASKQLLSIIDDFGKTLKRSVDKIEQGFKIKGVLKTEFSDEDKQAMLETHGCMLDLCGQLKKLLAKAGVVVG